MSLPRFTSFLLGGAIALLSAALPAYAAVSIGGNPPQGTVGTPYNFSFTVTGGAAPYTFSAFPGVPPGLSLSSTGVITGTPSAGLQNFPVTISATDANGVTGNRDVLFQVGTLPASSPIKFQSSLSDGNVGQDYFDNLRASGGTLPYTWSVSGLPGGLNSAGGMAFAPVVNGTPSTPGTFSIKVQIQDGANPPVITNGTVTIRIANFIFSTTSLPAATVGVAYSQQLQVTGGTPPYSFSGGPPVVLGMILDPTGKIIGTPRNATSVSFSVQAVDAAGLVAQATLSLTINPSASIPIITTPSLPDGLVGTPYSASFSASGGAPPYSFVLSDGSLPPGLSLSPSGVISGTPKATAINNEFTVRVTDSAGKTSTRNFVIGVSAAPLVITTTSVPPAPMNAPYTTTIAATGGTPPLTFFSGDLPAGFRLSSSGVLSGTGTVPGTFTFTVTVFDSAVPQNIVVKRMNLIVNVVLPFTITTTSPLPNGTVGTVYSQIFATANGTAPYTFTTAGGAVPPGLTLSTAGVLTGTPTQSGTYNFALQATDSLGATAAKAFVVNIAPGPPSITTAPNLPDASVGQAYAVTFAASGGTGQFTFSLAPGSTLPTGFQLSSSGVLAGTPTLAATSSFSVTVNDTGTGQSATKQFALKINGTPIVVTTPATLPNATVGVPYRTTFAATGGTGTGIKFTTTDTPPAGLSFDATSLSGTPTAPGTFNLTLTFADSGSVPVSKTFTLVVNPAGLAITNNSLPGGTVGTAYSQTINATGGIAPYSFSIVTGFAPNGVTLSAAGILAGTPTAPGSFTFVIQVTDSRSVSATQNFTVSMTAAPLLITAATLAPGQVGTAYSAALAATGGVAPYKFGISSGQLPSGLTLGTDGTISGTPTAPGNFGFIVTLSDSVGLVTAASFNIVINSAGLMISTLSPLPVGTVGSPYSQNLDAVGGAQPYTFALTSGSLPPGLSLSTAGVISGTPVSVGTANFTVTVRDTQSKSASQTYTLTVLAPAALTITTATLLSGVAGSPYLQTVTATGGAAPYSFTLASGTLPGGLTLSSGGTISGTPVASGNFTFIIRVADTTQASATKSFTITVAAGNAAIATSSLPDATVNSPYSQALLGVGGTPPYNFAVTDGSLPPGITLTPSGVLTGTPRSIGQYSFTVQMNDSAGASVTKPLSLSVTGIPALAVATTSLPPAVAGTAYSQPLSATGGTPPYSWSARSGGLPAGMALTSPGVLSGIPAIAGVFPFTVDLTDAAGASASAALTLVVGAPSGLSISTLSPLPSATAGVPYQVSFQAGGGTPPYSWSAPQSGIPDGLVLNTSGTLSGTPSTAGVYTFMIQVSDSTGATSSRPYSLGVGQGTPTAPPSITAVVNSASYALTALSPGEIVTIFGTGLGPQTLVTGTTTADGFVSTTLARTRVLFDGIPAPIIYVSDRQTSAIVPYEVAGNTSTRLQVEYQGVASEASTANVTDAAPGVYTANASGRGPGAILNQDYTLNSDANPALPGSVVILYATGEGETTPGGVNGKIALDTLPKPKAPVSVTVGGLPAQVLYAGAAPGIVAGGMQINLRLPDGVSGGPAPIVIKVGTKSSQAGVTVSIR